LLLLLVVVVIVNSQQRHYLSYTLPPYTDGHMYKFLLADPAYGFSCFFIAFIGLLDT
jgi:hypothetical protein